MNSANQSSRTTASYHEDHAQKIREAFAILTQGVEMIHYDTKHAKRGISKVKRIIWMDSDILRVCVDDKRSTLIDRAKGKMSPGLYMRDIAEVRAGFDSFDFKKNANAPTDPDLCLSLIGSERTISLELPGKMERDWFLERLQLIAHDILTVGEREEKEKRRWTNIGPQGLSALSENEITASVHLENVLISGIQIFSHKNGEIMRSILSFDQNKRSLELQPMERSYLGFLTHAAQTLDVKDIAEVRLGTHSIGFVRTGCTDKFRECISIIGTEAVFDVQFANENARDIFAAKFRMFVMCQQAKQND